MRAALGSMAFVAALVVGCGGTSDSGGGGGGSCTPETTAGVTIRSNGFAPRAVCVRPGGTVTLTNADSVAHDIQSGTTCTQLNVGPIAAGANAPVTFPTVMTCTFFDAAHSNEAAFQGTVAVSNGTTTGPGY